jgi:hypothetical protein
MSSALIKKGGRLYGDQLFGIQLYMYEKAEIFKDWTLQYISK